MEDTEEIWKDVVDFEGNYQISNMGNIKSLSREIFNGKVIFISKEKILKPGKAGSGYLFCVLRKDGFKKISSNHQLVAAAFLGHKPGLDGLIVDHINGDRLNNNIKNLRLTTYRNNMGECFRIDRDRLSSKYTGVCWGKHAHKWIAAIRINGERKHLGYFKDELVASDAYQQALKSIIQN